MPLHHTLLLPSSDRNPLTFESPLERFDNLSRNRTNRLKRNFLRDFPLFLYFYNKRITPNLITKVRRMYQ